MTYGRWDTCVVPTAVHTCRRDGVSRKIEVGRSVAGRTGLSTGRYAVANNTYSRAALYVAKVFLKTCNAATPVSPGRIYLMKRHLVLLDVQRRRCGHAHAGRGGCWCCRWRGDSACGAAGTLTLSSCPPRDNMVTPLQSVLVQLGADCALGARCVAWHLWPSSMCVDGHPMVSTHL